MMTKSEKRTAIVMKILNYLNENYKNEYTTIDFRLDTIARELFHLNSKTAGKPPYEDMLDSLEKELPLQ